MSRRAVLAHIGLVVVVPFCLVAGWWQVSRARSGNLLSWTYAVEWPLFAAVAAVMWWQLVHHERRAATVGPDSAPQDSAPPKTAAVRHREEEDPALRAYNDELELLATLGRPKTWRNPKGRP